MSDAVVVVSEEGYWGEECVEPLRTLVEADYDCTVATPTGGKPVIDERSVDPDQVGKELADRVQEAHQSDVHLNNPTALAEINPEYFDLAVFPGGHGTVWDINTDRHARELLQHMVETSDKKAVVICHAVGILAFTRGEDGSFLVEGRSVTGFPNAWEEGIVDERDLLPDGRKLPYWVEDEVKAAGGKWDAELGQDESVTVDGDLITVRGPASSQKGAEILLQELE
ncbi:MAG: type 1 glutamine amidotransferase domain-containing protein [bacterium]